MSKLPREMREPRKARSTGGDSWWYYVCPKRIEIMAASKTDLTVVILARKQLEKALEIMDKYQDI